MARARDPSDAAARRAWPLLVAALAVATTISTAVAPSAFATAGFTLTRLAGADRYDTAKVIGETTFGHADTALVASGLSFADALAGGYLAGYRGAPILLTAPDQVPAPTSAALSDLQVKHVVLLGGPAVITQAVADQLAATPSTNAVGGDLDVTRVAGDSRYDTAAAIARAPGFSYVGGVGGLRTALLASGLTFPDAVAASPVADAARFPVLLTDPSTLSPQASGALSDLAIDQVIVLGGPAAVSPAVEAAVQAQHVTTQRVAGSDRSDTSAKLAQWAIDNLGFGTAHVNVASGADSGLGVDALSGGPHGALDGPAPTLVTNSATDPGADATFLGTNKVTEVSAHVFGGPSALPDATLAALATAAGRGHTNQTFTVSPRGQQTRPVSSASNPGQGASTITVGGITGPVDVVLFPCPNVTTDALGDTHFLDAAPADGKADGQATSQTAQASITVINGAVQPPATRAAGPINPQSDGTVVVTVDSTAFDCADVVTFADDTPANGLLDLDSSHRPVERFSVGGPVGWVPAQAPNGSTGGVVQYVDRSQLVLVANGQRYDLRPNDTPYYANSYRVAFDTFVADVSVGDAFDFFFGNYAQVGPNTFNLYQDLPGLPTLASGATGDFDNDPANSVSNDVRLTWGAPSPLDGTIDHYVVRRYTGDGTTLELTSSTPAGSGPYQTRATDVDVPSGPHRYTVQAVSATGDVGPVSDPALVTVA